MLHDGIHSIFKRGVATEDQRYSTGLSMEQRNGSSNDRRTTGIEPHLWRLVSIQIRWLPAFAFCS
jgi:hypothetical protein